jgi:uncharacterized sulfatase
MVSWFDNTVGEIVAHLEAQGLRENTLIVYMADNGISLQADIAPDINNTGSGDGKESPYEMGNRTPIIFNWPAHWKPAQRDALISNIDVFPTLMDLLQSSIENISGNSVLAVITENRTPRRDFVVGEGYLDSGTEVFDNLRQFRWIRRNEGGRQWKLIRHQAGTTELFDLAQDANEKHNLSEDPSTHSVRIDLLEKLNTTLP